MPKSDEYSDPNETASFFYKTNKFFLICGLPGYIKWRYSGYTKAKYAYIQSFLTVCLFIFVLMEQGALITQRNLSEKQAADSWLFAFSHPILLSYAYVMEHHKERIRDLLHKLCIDLKNVYNDPKVERQMIKKSKMYSAAFLFILLNAVIFYGVDGVFEVLRGRTFTTVITAWPDVTDKSTAAHIFRVYSYLMFWVCMIRCCAVYVLIIMIGGCLCFQFKNLRSYFYSLNRIFDAVQSEADHDDEAAEKKYEEALAVGIKLHADTLWCTSKFQTVCSYVYSGQIIVNVTVICLMMIQMTHTTRTLSTAFSIVMSTMALLCSSGTIILSAGDVTVEASLLPNAMYGSGWQNCRSKTRRVRTLLVIAMMQAQRPVVIRGFGILEISYQAYVSMVKSSYSVFSILY